MPEKSLNKFWALCVAMGCMLSSTTWAQQETPHPGANSSAPAHASSQTELGSAPASNAGSVGTEATKQTRITPAEAQELFRSVDDILKFASQDTGLLLHHPVQRELVDRDHLSKYIQDRMEKDEDAQRLQRSELVLKKFGLLPPDFNLKQFLVGLLREQVAAYYDTQKRTVNLLDWVDPEVQRMVLAHELTHALQDQALQNQDFSLESWIKHGPKDTSQRIVDVRRTSDPADVGGVDDDEQVAARQAVIEGQAMIVLLDYQLAPMHQSVLDVPQVVEAMKQGLIAGSPIFNRAPLYVKESLTFPYTYGLDFERSVLQLAGKQKAFAGMLRHPPQSTRQIMQPATYLGNEHIEPMRVPEIRQALGKDYEQVDVGAIGEFDVSVLLKQFAGEDVAKRLWPQWRGGYYYAARRKSLPAGPILLVYFSKWAEAGQATQFAQIYADSLKKKYQKLAPVTLRSQSAPQRGGGSVQVAIADPTTKWESESGPVFVEQHGDTVLVMETFDEGTAARVRQVVLGTRADRSQLRE